MEDNGPIYLYVMAKQKILSVFSRVTLESRSTHYFCPVMMSVVGLLCRSC